MKYKVPNVVRGGRAIPLNNSSNLFYMKGRKHNKGGIDIGKDARTGIEVEDDEVMQLNNNNIRVFSSEPFLSGNSPSHLVMNGADPNTVFNAQEAYKKAHHLNDDGTRKAKHGKGLTRKKDYVSSNKPYPSVASGDFAGGGRSYPIPTEADAVDALRLAGLHGREDVKAKVYAKYPELRKKASLGTMLKKFRHIRNLFNTNRYVSGDELKYGGRRKAATGTIKQFTPFTDVNQTDNNYENNLNNYITNTVNTWIPNILHQQMNKQFGDTEFEKNLSKEYQQVNDDDKKQAIKQEKNDQIPQTDWDSILNSNWFTMPNYLEESEILLPSEQIEKEHQEALAKYTEWHPTSEIYNSWNPNEYASFGDYFVKRLQDPDLYGDRLEFKELAENPGGISWLPENTPNKEPLYITDVIKYKDGKYRNEYKLACLAWDKAKGVGLSDEQAAAVVGHITRESNLISNNTNKWSGAFGLFQMMPNSDMYKKYRTWCNKNNLDYEDPDAQLDYAFEVMGHNITSEVAKTWKNYNYYKLPDAIEKLIAEEVAEKNIDLTTDIGQRLEREIRGNYIRKYNWINENGDNVNDILRAIDFLMWDMGKGTEPEVHLYTRTKNAADWYAHMMSQQNENNQQKKLGGTMRTQYKKGGSKVLRKKAVYGDEEDEKTKKTDEQNESTDSTPQLISDGPNTYLDENGSEILKPDKLVDPTKKDKEEPTWQTRFDWENMSNLGLNTLGSIIGGGVNAAMLNKRKYIGPPVLLQGSKMRTKYNINPQIGAINSTRDDIIRNTNNNTASSKVANNRNNAARLTALQEKNQAYADKNNKETEMINEAAKQNNTVHAANVQAINEWRKDKNTFDNETREKKAENINDLMSNLNKSLQQHITNREKSKQFDLNMATYAASRPNTDPEIFKYYMEKLGSPTFFRKVDYNANNRTKKRSKRQK